MVKKRAEVLVAVRVLEAPVTPVVVPRHHRHVLQVTLPAFRADGAVVRMIDHQRLDDGFAEFARFFAVQRQPHALGDGRHAAHHETAARILRVRELQHGALAAGADRAECRMPAEVGQIEAQRQAAVEQVAPRLDLV